MFLARPMPQNETILLWDAVVEEIQKHYPQIKRTLSRKEGGLTQEGNQSLEILDRKAKHYVDLLEKYLSFLKKGEKIGLWRYTGYFFSPQEDTYRKLKVMLKAVFSSGESAVEPVRTLDLKPIRGVEKILQNGLVITDDYPKATLEHITRLPYQSLITSDRLGLLLSPPKEEKPGYQVFQAVGFATSGPLLKTQDKIHLGQILDWENPTGHSLELPTSDLTMHALVSGITGSGKTNTCMCIVEQLYKKNIPSLIIEPAKREYRQLALSSSSSLKGSIRVFTLGNETQCPFRLNPFEAIEGFNILTHIDFLKAVFNASFAMYGPMPFILEQCLYEIYQDRGWDLSEGTNRWAVPGGQEDIYPTLEDLYRKIDEIVPAIGYGEELTMDVRGALRARVKSLCVGNKGLMLNCRHSIPMDYLLDKPCLIEMENIGDDQEKAFVMGLILLRLYEHRRLQGSREELIHITLVEEAHRLLKNSLSTRVASDVPDSASKAIETFSNMLAEVRAYGEGIVISEQIPSKLTPDALKNSNLKILHRMVARDERNIVGDAMILNDRQKKYVATISSGKAVVFAGGFHAPFFIQVPHIKKLIFEKASKGSEQRSKREGEDLRKNLKDVEPYYARLPECAPCSRKCRLYESAKEIVREYNLDPLFSLAITCLLWSGIKVSFGSDISYSIKAIVEKEKKVQVDKDLLHCILILLAETYIRQRSSYYEVPRAQVEGLRTNLTNGLIHKPAVGEQSLKFFLQNWSKYLERRTTERALCKFCPHLICIGYELDPYIDDNSMDAKLLRTMALEDHESLPPARYRKILVETISQAFGIPTLPEIVDEGIFSILASCFYIQNFSEDTPEELREAIRNHFPEQIGS